MDAYTAKVSQKQLPWAKSKKTKEWKLLKESIRLLKKMRRLRPVKSRPPTSAQPIHTSGWKSFTNNMRIGE